MTFNHDAIVVGAGLFGATIARALRDTGRKVLVLDDERPLSGSMPSGCLMKPSWFSSMGKDLYDPALETLDSIYGITDLNFYVGAMSLAVRTTVHWIPNDKVLDLSREVDILVQKKTVTNVEKEKVWTRDDPYPHESPIIVVAAGYWTNQIGHKGDNTLVPGLIGKQGVSMRIIAKLPENFIHPWAPYKQAVAFQENPNWVWAGDGSAIKPENWTQDRQDQSIRRMAKHTGLSEMNRDHAITGIRPLVPKKKFVLEEPEPGLWIATGGAKNGMIGAGWCAHEIARKTS